jgi:hypothetical protein
MRRDVLDDAVLYRAAMRLAQRRGVTAVTFAAHQARSLFDSGDVAGALIWRRLWWAVREVQRGPRRGETIN